LKIIKDAKGREYCLKLTYGVIEEIRAKANVDLLDVAHLDMDGVKLAKVLCIACADSLEKEKITAQEFMDALEGDEVEAAGAALWEELLRFFPSSRRETIQKMFAAATRVIDKQVEAAKAKLESGEMEKVFETILTGTSGVAPVSSASTPETSHTANSD